MKESLVKRFCFFATLLYLSVTIVSCNTAKKIKYFQDIPDSGQFKSIPKAEYTEPLIQSDDILTVIVQTIDPTATAAINSGNISNIVGSSIGANTVSQQSVTGYLVDKDGNIELPFVGQVKVVGLTTSQAREVIRKKTNEFYKNPSVIVRFANFKIGVLGEVNKPGTYVLPNEKVTIFDALGLAGDLTIYGKRDNVLLIRQNADGVKESYRINLKDTRVLSSPYFYLKQNDVVYVEALPAKIANTDAAQTRVFALVGTLLSLFIVIATRAK